ncbi:MAG: ABC transporter ATP-binding protein [Oligoflexia bacterium]|nr:ABC transporter ATP-binding protein [Oligoflexia bacterium]
MKKNSLESFAPFAVEMKGIRKAFGGCVASRDIHLQVKAGSIHAIVGENGAGKSTAMKMLYGMLKPDAGEIWIRGEKRRWRSPQDAIRAGIGMVHQHFMLAGPYSVLENIILGDEPRLALGWIDRKAAREKLEALSARYKLTLPWDQEVAALGVGMQQRIEIIKLLYRNASILILDEPTAVLTPQETAELFVQLRRLRDEGKTVLLITHKLKEVLELSDEVTVFRGGEVVGHRLTQNTNADDLATLMVGRKVNLRAEVPPPPQLGEAVLQVPELGFEVRAGEIVGIAGVEGNGQSELLAGLPRGFAGFIPEDRHREGLLLDRPVSESFVLGHQRRKPYGHRFCGIWMLDRAAIETEYARAAEEYDIRPRSPQVNARDLSGGNQQKVIFAREMGLRGGKAPELLVAAQPTRGVDVGAIELIHARMIQVRNEGTGVLLVSSELEEVMALSDRILVIYGGKIVARFARGEADEHKIGFYMGGGVA